MIYTPFVSINMLLAQKEMGALLNPSVCTKIDYKGFEISISMDSSLKFGRDLTRTDIRVYDKAHSGDVTDAFLQGDERMLYGDAETLLRVMKQIEQM